MTAPCQFLEWDSRFFGCRVARVDTHHLRNDTISSILAWCHQHAIDCLYFLSAADDAESVAIAEAHGFGMKDVRVTYEHTLASRPPVPTAPPAGVVVRPVQPGDVATLEQIARNSYADSRFSFDTRFPHPAVQALYSTWLRNSCSGDAAMVLVAEHQQQPAGYITCHLPDAPRGHIGLVGMDAAVRGKGIGQHLMQHVLRWFGEQGSPLVTVVTQGRNMTAQRFYQRAGFLVQATQIWYHKWFDERLARPDMFAPWLNTASHSTEQR